MLRSKIVKTAILLAIATVIVATLSCSDNKTDQPNVIIVITDDQGYGDLGFTGNPIIETPNIDAMAERSALMTNYYVSPVCAPTRASLMTGRYNYRTRCIDTYVGRAMMEPDEVTLAEILADNGYATGIFGKWHLGDNYPMRPQDQGFEEVLVHRGGGIGQPSDPIGAEGKYTDPILFHNGAPVQEKGYCTDIYFDRAVQWLENTVKNDRSFFLYLPTNAPHGPFHDVPQDQYDKYAAMNLANDLFPQTNGHPLPDASDNDRRARIFAMISNIDDNVGRLFDKLDEMQITENTIVLFMVDNGPNGRRYVAGLNGSKTSVYEGGIKSPLFMHWPAQLESGRSSDRVVGHIDILPTLLDACGINPGTGAGFDGRSFLPLLTREETDWQDRHIVIQAHRGNQPVRYHNFAIRNQDWKLLHASGFQKENFEGAAEFELYNLREDPYEMQNLMATEAHVFEAMKAAYDGWFDDVGSTRPDNYAPPRIFIGTTHENPVVLTRQDWRHTKSRPWAKDSNGFWLLHAPDAGIHDILIHVRDQDSRGTLNLNIGDMTYTAGFSKTDKTLIIQGVRIPAGDTVLQATLQTDGTNLGAWQVEVQRTDSNQ